MKKLLLLTAGIGLGILLVVGLGSVTVEITVPDGSVTRILSAFGGLSGKVMSLEIMPDDSENPLIGRWSFSIPVKDANETQQEFAKRFTKDLIRSSVRLYESAKAYNDYKETVKKIPRPDVNVPDEIVE